MCVLERYSINPQHPLDVSSVTSPHKITEAKKTAIECVSGVCCSDPSLEKVKSQQYFFSIIPASLGASEGMQLRKKQYGLIRAALKDKSPDYNLLKAMKRRVKRHLLKQFSKNCQGAHSGHDAENTLLLLLTEHKKHTFERFIVLPKLYTAFKLHCHIIIEKLNSKNKGLGEKFKTIVLELLFFSLPYSDRRKLMRSRASYLGLRFLEKTTDKDYRKREIMGYEEQGTYSKEDRSDFLTKINSFFEGDKENFPVKNFQRAHTLPFPGLFSWTHAAMTECLQYHGIAISDEYHPKAELSAEALKILRDGDTDDSQMMAAFTQEYERYCGKETLSDSQLTYKSLLFLKELYLRMFSETEFFPDFMNEEIDKLSEWTKSKLIKDDYHSTLGLALCMYVSRSAKAKLLLNNYFHTTSANVIKAAENLLQKTPSRLDQFKLLCIFQVLQSLQFPGMRASKDLTRLATLVDAKFGEST